jgi:hypothetical protein
VIWIWLWSATAFYASTSSEIAESLPFSNKTINFV